MRTARRLAAATVLALTVAACSEQLVPEDVLPTAIPLPSELPSELAPEQPPADDGTGGDDGTTTDDGSQDGGTAAPDQGQPDDGQPAEEQGPSLTPVDDDGPVGANAVAYLRGDRPTVVLEIDTQSGVSLPSSAVQHVSAVLDRESNASVVVRQGPATSTTREAWTVDQLRAAAAETRGAGSSDDEAVMQLLVLGGGFERDGVLGVAFDASTMAVFPDQWSNLGSLVLSDAAIARSVSLHEVGHVLGLVGLAREPTSDHEDPDHPGHTTDRDDVMYYAIETDAIAQLTGSVPDDFGPRTRADLAAMREG